MKLSMRAAAMLGGLVAMLCATAIDAHTTKARAETVSNLPSGWAAVCASINQSIAGVNGPGCAASRKDKSRAHEFGFILTASQFYFFIVSKHHLRDLSLGSETTVVIDGRPIRTTVLYRDVQTDGLNLALEPTTLAPNVVADVVARGSSAMVMSNDPETLSLKGTRSALSATVATLDDAGIDMSAFGYDPGDDSPNQEVADPGKTKNTPETPFGHCMAADAYEACTTDTVGNNNWHHAYNDKCPGDTLYRLTCVTSESGQEACSGSPLNYNPSHEGTGSSGDDIEYNTQSSGGLMTQNVILVVLYDRPDSQDCIDRLQSDYDTFLHGGGSREPNYRANLVEDGMPIHEP